MRNLFRGYYTPSQEELKSLWKECTFVLDANVLLNLYRYPKEAREDFLRLLRQVQDRLWIPHQAALEYQRNRLKVIAEQVKRFGEVRGVLAGIRAKLRSDLEQLQLKKRHPSIDPEKLLARTDTAFADFEKELEAFEQQQPDVFDEDKIRAELDELLAGRIGPPPSQDLLDEIAREGKRRFEQKRPPGYADVERKSEDEVYFAGGLIFNRLYGDLILWRELMAETKGKKLEKVIFVTDDQKEDWWWIVESQGKKRIGPRPELVDEMFTEGGAAGFYMYNSERFLEFAKINLGARVKEESIEQVRDTASANPRPGSLLEFYSRAEQAVLAWLRKTHPHDDVSSNSTRFPDFFVRDPETGRKTAYDVRVLRDLSLTIRSMQAAEVKVPREIRKGTFEECVIVLVVETAEKAAQASQRLEALILERPKEVRYCVGTLSEGEPPSFEVLATI